MSRRIGLYGGSFDPIHFGHLISARSIAEQLSLDRVVLIPSARPPHKQDCRLAAGEHRLNMARLATQGDDLFEVSDLELNRTGPSYTFDTVADFRARLGADTEIVWIIGADSLPELPTWYRIADLAQSARIVTATRPGWTPPTSSALAHAIGPLAAEQLIRDCVPTPAVEISATEIRSRIRAGRSIRYLTPDGVQSYIVSHSLYRGQA